MQKLVGRNTFTPIGTPQACGNCGCALKVLQGRDGVYGLKTLSNNSDEDHPLHRGGSDLRVQNIVYVLNMRGESLMPTKQQKARKLLKCGKAEVVRRNPFTIQLKYGCGENKQPIVLGVDSGYSHVGLSAVTKKQEVYSADVTLRKDIVKLNMERRMYRRVRRGRKVWHRKARFLNRKKEEGWIAPSLQHKVDTHIKLVAQLKKILPITKIIVEVASFDSQKMQNPEVSGVEYQQGELQGYEVREYLLEKWNRKCAYCNKKNIPLQVEHIIPKSRGGINRVSNLTMSCEPCNKKKDSLTAEEFGFPNIQAKTSKTLRALPFMNIVRSRIVDLLGYEVTYGYQTKHDRIKLGLEKSHVNDAFCIAGGVGLRCLPFVVTQTRRNNRSIQVNRNGHKPSIRKNRYILQPNDLVIFQNTSCLVKGVFNYGKWIRLKDSKQNIINSNIKNVELIKYGKGIQHS